MAVAREHIDRGASVRVPMSYEEWQALGETKHQEWSEGVLYVNPPTRWHVVVCKQLARRLDDASGEEAETAGPLAVRLDPGALAPR